MKRTFVAFLLTALISVAGCEKNWESHYGTAADASRDGAFSRGWLPEILLPDASDIRESHDLDSNHGEATFRLTRQLADRVEQACAHIPAGQEVSGPFDSHTLFNFGAKPSQHFHGRQQYRCNAFVVRLDLDREVGYLWH